MTVYATMPSPIDPLLLTATDTALTGLYMSPFEIEAGWREDPEQPVLLAARAQLEAYFAGAREIFDLPLLPMGTPFQQAVWRLLLTIPHGVTTSYGALAARLGQPGAARAVGLANGSNPISIIIPCHRVIGANGALTGYGGGIERKRWLLAHETGGMKPSGVQGHLAL
jgi:O-6-methylguanine DNA methyltransferase